MSLDRVRPGRETDRIDTLTSLREVAQTSRDTTAGSDGPASSTVSDGDGAHISKLARLFSKLHTLATSDPARFRQVTAEFATRLSAEAAKADGPQGQFLARLAGKFSQASQTGDISALKPQTAVGSRVPSAYSTSSTSALSAAISGSTSTGSTDTVAALFQRLEQKLNAQF